ncbi:MAG: tetratricopeptide repeat protein [Acidobacteriota bacterium]|nr:tetratricopeptide repeat protein [Blastocatellia bacterium]MDW8238676.1 tetratricopeptide repeat protein [Acidobacteriota bacterium]
MQLLAFWKRAGLLLLFGSLLLLGYLHAYNRVRSQMLNLTVGDAGNLHRSLALNPQQPAVHSRLGMYYLSNPILFDPERALHHFQAAVQLEPFSHRAWSDVARGYEQMNQPTQAAAAYQMAITLAPHFFRPHWMYANFLLRQGQIESAIAAFRRVVEIDPRSSEAVCQTLWQATGGDAGAVARFGHSLQTAGAQWGIGQCLAQRGQYGPSLELWRAVPAADPLKREAGRWLLASLREAKQWSYLNEVWREVAPLVEPHTSPAEDLFWNGGFEREPIRYGFDWVISSTEQVEARMDTTTAHQGRRSLRLDFKHHQNVFYDGVSHDLAVRPLTRYRLQFYYKTEGLLATHGVAVVLTDVEDSGRFRVQSAPLSAEPDWTLGQMELTTPAETRFIRLTLVRLVGEKIYDFIQGRVWFDSFAFMPVDHAAAQSRS